ncbi:PDZ domain-containing protein [Brevibacillus ruminantium]|uniref:PDZ domain-containing protein n=1 Tax=Brevibacillus ruminantium TaxID=2950604 RepID=A0ABY4WDX9_9BACL|nr:PDZ domain-containing protein [Brevibacillus ruminantium]USG65272.1 PDZ domain-containing protein [Brevibacillus ruminantium]
MTMHGDILSILAGFGRFFLNPVFYLFLLLIYLHYRRQMLLERQLFAVRIQSPLQQTVRALGMGVAGGLLISCLSAALGIVIQMQDLWLLWGLAALLALIRLRYLCFAYAAGLLAIFQPVASLLPGLESAPVIGGVWNMIAQAKPMPLLALVAIMHLIEALLVRWNRGRDASPLFVEGQRGRIVGAYLLHSFWVTPLVLFVPVDAGGFSGTLYSGWPFFASGAASYGLLLLPSVTGFSALTQTETAERKAGQISRQLTAYALLLLGLTALALLWSPLTFLAALFALLGHEGLFWLGEWQERQKAPYFIQSSRGVKVMAVLPGTPAEEIGIRPGEIIVKVNGQAVHKKEDLYPALQVNSAFCKMEVLTLEGEVKFVQCAVYAGNHHQLGIIVVPDASTRVFVDMQQASVVQLVKQKLEKLNLGA